SKSTMTFIAQASGALAGTTAPFTSVEFWLRPGNAGPWRRLSQVSTGVEGNNQGVHTWSYSYVWNPDATDAPFTNLSTTGMSVIAVGITSTGQVVATQASQNVFVRVP